MFKRVAVCVCLYVCSPHFIAVCLFFIQRNVGRKKCTKPTAIILCTGTFEHEVNVCTPFDVVVCVCGLCRLYDAASATAAAATAIPFGVRKRCL